MSSNRKRRHLQAAVPPKPEPAASGFWPILIVSAAVIAAMAVFVGNWNSGGYWLMNIHAGYRRLCYWYGIALCMAAALCLLLPPLLRGVTAVLNDVLDGLTKNADRAVVVLTIVTFLFFSFMKVSAYLFFQTNHDFVWYINTVWNTLHGRWFYSSVGGGSFFSTHFTPIVGLFSPLLLLWQSPIIIIMGESALQALAVFFCFRLAETLGYSKRAAMVWTLMLIFNPYFHHNTNEWFHPVSLGLSIFLLWFICYERRSKWIIAATLLALSLNEAVPLILAGLGLFAIVEKRWALGGALLVTGVAGWCLEVLYIIPHCKGTMGSAQHFMLASYSDLGSSYSEIARNLLKPSYWPVVCRLFLSPYSLVNTIQLLTTTGTSLFVFFQPICLIPIAFSLAPYVLSPTGGTLTPHIFGDDFGGQYTMHHAAALIAILLWVSMRGLRRMPILPARILSFRPVFFLFLAAYGIYISCKAVVPGNTPGWVYATLNRAMALIPEDAAVWAPPFLGAHAPFRKNLKCIPPTFGYAIFFEHEVFDPDYIVTVEPFENIFRAYPSYKPKFDDVLSRARPEVVMNESGIAVLKLHYAVPGAIGNQPS